LRKIYILRGISGGNNFFQVFLKIPNGPYCVFRDPNQQIELAIYENIRPEVDGKLAGQIDS
jgi:hypothetical protein